VQFLIFSLGLPVPHAGRYIAGPYTQKQGGSSRPFLFGMVWLLRLVCRVYLVSLMQPSWPVRPN